MTEEDAANMAHAVMRIAAPLALRVLRAAAGSNFSFVIPLPSFGIVARTVPERPARFDPFDRAGDS